MSTPPASPSPAGAPSSRRYRRTSLRAALRPDGRSRVARLRRRARRPQRGPLLRRLAPGAALFVTLCAVGTVWSLAAPRAQSAEGADPNAFTAAEVARGAGLFTQGCSSCHGAAGQGGSQAPSLIGVGAAAVDFQVGTGRMPLKQPGPQAERHDQQYAPAEIRALDAYVASLGPGPAIPLVDAAQGDLGRGGELFRANCQQCHNPVGAGGALTSGKYAPVIYPATDTQVGEAIRHGPEQMPVFAPTQLSEQQVNDIVRYVQFLRAPNDPGGSGLGHTGAVPEGMVIWLVGLVGVLGACLWIGSRA